MIEGQEYLNVKEGAEFLGISRSFLYKLIEQGDVPVSRALHKNYVKRSDLEKLIVPKK